MGRGNEGQERGKCEGRGKYHTKKDVITVSKR